MDKYYITGEKMQMHKEKFVIGLYKLKLTDTQILQISKLAEDTLYKKYIDISEEELIRKGGQ